MAKDVGGLVRHPDFSLGQVVAAGRVEVGDELLIATFSPLVL